MRSQYATWIKTYFNETLRLENGSLSGLSSESIFVGNDQLMVRVMPLIIKETKSI